METKEAVFLIGGLLLAGLLNIFMFNNFPTHTGYAHVAAGAVLLINLFTASDGMMPKNQIAQWVVGAAGLIIISFAASVVLQIAGKVTG